MATIAKSSRRILDLAAAERAVGSPDADLFERVAESARICCDDEERSAELLGYLLALREPTFSEMGAGVSTKAQQARNTMARRALRFLGYGS